ncbi:hypothetical protein HpCK64_12690 [Helicobacter pylori]
MTIAMSKNMLENIVCSKATNSLKALIWCVIFLSSYLIPNKMTFLTHNWTRHYNILIATIQEKARA